MSNSADGELRIQAQSATRSRGWWPVVALLMLVVALGHFNRIAISVAGAERIIPEGGIDEARMGQIYSAFLLIYTLAMLPAGWLIDRVGARATLIVFCFGSAIFVAGTSAVGLFSKTPASLWMGLLAVRSLMGLVNAPLHPAAARMVYAHVPAQAKSLANGLVTFAACAGISATYYGFGALIDGFSWPGAFLVTGWITLAVALSWTWGTRDLPPSVESFKANSSGPHGPTNPLPSSPAESAGNVLLRPGVICLAFSYAALGYFQYLFFYWIQYYIGTVQHLGADVSRRYSTIITLAMGLGMIFGGWLADRVSRHSSDLSRRRLVPGLGMVASGVVFELGLLSADSRIMITTFILSAGLLGMCEAAFWTTIVELGTPRGGLAAGLMNMGGNAGGMLSPFATPLLSACFGSLYGKELGWRISLAIAGAVSVLGALMWFGVKTGQQERFTDETSKS
ncbi:MAG TPA: MFS transporter [Planctomycetaceae bacterium]|jgi:MFS family permease|nr:MFS transporter [Planctomycetaceae bacterium]